MKAYLIECVKFVSSVAICCGLARGVAFVVMYGRDKITLGSTAVTVLLSVIFLAIWQKSN